MDFWHEAFESTPGSSINWCRWSDIVVAMLTDIISWEIILENILPVRVFEWLVILVDCKINVIKEFEARESKNSFIGWWSL